MPLGLQGLAHSAGCSQCRKERNRRLCTRQPQPEEDEKRGQEGNIDDAVGSVEERGNQAHDHSQPQKHSFTHVYLGTAHCRQQSADCRPPSKDHGLRHVSRHAAYTKHFTIKSQEQHNMNDKFCAAWGIFSIKAQQHSSPRQATAPTSASSSASAFASCPQDQMFARPTSPSSRSLDP